MARKQVVILCLLSLSIGLAAAGDWSILNYVTGKKEVKISLKNYCESWRMNVELNNIQAFEVVPGECVDFIGKYMTSKQYKVDVQRAAEECTLFLTNTFALGGDAMDAWVFDVDDTLLSTVPYYKKHQFGAVLGCRGAKMNRTSLEKWMEEGSAPAIEHMVELYQEIKSRGLKIFLISSRGEHLRDVTVDNLIKVGYHGWTELILRCPEELNNGVQSYKAEQRKKLMKRGYRLWGIVGDQWSNLVGNPSAKRTFKLPNPMYYYS